MPRLLLILLLSLVSFQVTAQKNKARYDKKLAQKLGGDEHGMKMYVLAILKTGPAKIENKTTLDSLFKGHMANIGRLADEGKLVVAGPLKKNEKTYRGIFILNAKNPEEANLLLQTDPAIKAGVFETEVFEWYGSAALPEYLKSHEKIQKQKP